MGVPLGEPRQAKEVHRPGMPLCTRNDSWGFHRDMSGSQALQDDFRGSAGVPLAPEDCHCVSLP